MPQRIAIRVCARFVRVLYLLLFQRLCVAQSSRPIVLVRSAICSSCCTFLSTPLLVVVQVWHIPIVKDALGGQPPVSPMWGYIVLPTTPAYDIRSHPYWYPPCTNILTLPDTSLTDHHGYSRCADAKPAVSSFQQP